MDRALEKLIRTLERLALLYGELLAISREKTDFLVSCDSEAIEASQAREDMIVTKLAQMASLRDESLAEAGRVVALDSATPLTISSIMLRLGDEMSETREKLGELRGELKQLARDIGAVNRLNEELCTQSLMHLEGYMNLLTGRAGKGQMYDAKGRSQQHSGRALVNRSA